MGPISLVKSDSLLFPTGHSHFSFILFLFLSSLLFFLSLFFFFCSSSEQNLTHTERQKNLNPPHPRPLFSDLQAVLYSSSFPRRPIRQTTHKRVSVSDPLISKIKKQNFQFQYHSPPRKDIFTKLQKSHMPTLLKTTKHKANYVLVPL